MTESYQGGYTKALLDVKEFFEVHSEALKRNRCYNAKMIPVILDGLINARHKMMEVGGANLSMKLLKDSKKLVLC